MEVPLSLYHQYGNKHSDTEELENLNNQAQTEAQNYLGGVLSSTKKDAIKSLIEEYRNNKCDHCFFMRYLENLEANPSLVDTE
mmetsp:Transcript_18487/g.20639  ORF Transcript_18487/g.20639 Transcript_18487/m.20639 type:complete len:83 (-) Transcript_18487:22-270(-)